MSNVEVKAQTGPMAADLDFTGCYRQSFGPLPHLTRISDLVRGVDVRPQLKAIALRGVQSIQMKALGPTTGGAGTAGYAMVPVYLDPRMHDESRKYTPLVEFIPRVTNLGLTADYNVVTAKGAAYTANADAALPEADPTVTRRSKSIKYLYSVGRVLGPAQAAMPSYIMEGFQATGAGNVPGTPFNSLAAPNAKQMLVLLAARAMKELEENLILNGDSSSDATQFDGLIVQQSTTNRNAIGTALSWNDVETTVRYAFDDGGRPKLAVAPSSVMQDLRKLMIDQFRWNPADAADNRLTFGVPAAIILNTMVGPIPCIPSMYLSNSGGSKQLWFFDTDFIEMRVLQDMTYEDLAKTNDSSKFMLKIYECVINRAPAFCSFIDTIS